MSNNKNEATFNATVDGKDIVFELKPLTIAAQREAQKVYNQAFSDAIKTGSIVRAKLDDLLKEQGLWDEKKETKFKTIQKQLLDKEKKLAEGGISIKQAKTIAIEMKKLRLEMRDLIANRTELDNHTAEGQADNARFNYMVSASVVYKDSQKPYFNNYEDYLNRSSSEVAIKAAQKLASAIYGLDSDFEKKLPENKFLLQYKLVDESLNYIDKNNRRIDEDGRLIDESGRYVDEQGNFVDKEGNPVSESGDYIVNFTPFLDDDGKPIILDKTETVTNDAK
ncbi:MAG: hypothetical protein EBR67_10420 [Proteobacteria bacterium]|nr:hypothetical protein [Pseudomonadota bacterium]